MSIDIHIRHAGGVTIFDLSGRLIAGAEGDQLCAALRLAHEAGEQLMLLNCEGLVYVDSCGIGDLVAAYATIIRRGGVVRLLNPTQQLRRLLAVTGLDSLFEVDQDELTAVASFNSAGHLRAQQKLREFLEPED